MKTFKKCLAIVLAVAGAATLAGCNNGSSDHRTATTANWNVRTSASVEKNSFDFWQKNIEVATYSVSFKEGENSSYKVSYDTASAEYVTRFYMGEYDWSTDQTIEAYRTEESEKEPVYVYETSLVINGSYEMKSGGEKKNFSDELTTVSYFRPAADNLQPVYSYQKVKNTAPATLTANSIASAIVEIDEEYETFYNKRCSQATVVKTVSGKDGKETKKIDLQSGYSNFDNSQLRAAVRAFTLSGGSSHSFYVLSPQNGGIQAVSASVASPVELGENDAAITDALLNAPENYIFFDGQIADKKEGEKDRNFRYSAVSLSVKQSLKGTSPAWWYTTVENNDLNSTRCVLLKMSTPLAFSMGTLTYTLSSLDIEPIS